MAPSSPPAARLSLCPTCGTAAAAAKSPRCYDGWDLLLELRATRAHGGEPTAAHVCVSRDVFF